MNNKLTKNQSHNARNYPGSDLLSSGVLRPVPEQQLRFSLTRVQSPYGHYNTQLSWSSFTTEGNSTLDPTRSSFTHEWNSTLDPTRSSFTHERKHHKENRMNSSP
ncbi:hypothetical protein Taro_000167 [Colocasia esculenta]|uniref:Uncharacterized protein n=1 Tax=Colocasia esculenta TaxID=4460 RepID=A0A843T722_COLES|nr:hypothetical protein [Colocasia esculenta]